MKLPEISMFTAVDDLRNDIKDLQQALEKANGVGKASIQKKIDARKDSISKLVEIYNEGAKLIDSNNLDAQIELANLAKENYRALSLNKWNDFVQRHGNGKIRQKNAFDLEPDKDTFGSLMSFSNNMKERGLGATSVLKASLFGAAVAGAIELGAIPLIAGALSALPVSVAIFAGVAGIALAKKALDKVLGRELNELGMSLESHHLAKMAYKRSRNERKSKENTIDIEDIEKRNEEAQNKTNLIDSFRDKAYDIANGIDARTIEDLKKDDAFKDLTNEEKEKILTELGLSKPALANTYNELKGSLKNGTYEMHAYNAFKKQYDAIITTFSDPNMTPAQRGSLIRNLSTYANKTAFFEKGKAPAANSPEDLRAEKLALLCKGSMEILNELAKTLAKDKDKSKDEESVKKAHAEILKKHGLNENSLDELTTGQ